MESWKKSRLGQDSNSWSCNWTALYCTIELSSHPRAVHFWARVPSSGSNINCHLVDLSYTLRPIYISYGQLKTTLESATLRKAWWLSGRAEFNVIARSWVRVLFKTLSLSVFSATALLVSLTAVITRGSQCNLSFVVEEFSSISTKSSLC